MAKRLFLLYAAEDEGLRDELDRQLAVLRRMDAAVIWHDRRRPAGEDTASWMEDQIDSADLILLLVTPDFLASDELQDEQVARALGRRDTADARVVPVLVRPCVWEVGTLSRLSPLPANREAVTSWSNRDEAWREVVRGVLSLLSEGPAPDAGLPDAPAAPAEMRVQNEVRTLEERLLAARSRREKLGRAEGGEAARRMVDAEILDLRRKLRERGQLAVGDALSKDRYVLIELLGKGGFATVWKAYDEETREEVAIKVLHPQLMREETRRERFFRGARVMASLQHPGIVRVLEPEGHDRGFDYFVMELVRGSTLRDAIVEGRLARAGILPALLDVGNALAAAHAAGHVHRDVKPANILLDEDNHPKLTDFDLVGGGQTTGGTRTGALGTFVYAAPEAMVNAADADARADVYGLGMTGVFCYHGKDLPPSVMRDVGRVIRALSCPEEVQSALLRATEWEAKDRWPDLGAFCEALRAPPRAPLNPMPSAPQVKAPSPKATVELSPRPSLRSVQASLAEGLQQSWTVHPPDRYGRYATFSVGGAMLRMRWIARGRFLMGSPESEVGRDRDEGPQHEVELSRGFWLTETPCTQALWEAVMGNNPSRRKAPKCPVEGVSWLDCQEFLRKLNALVPAVTLRLPSEAEWEYACRGGTTQATWAGDLAIKGLSAAPTLHRIAWYGGNSRVGHDQTGRLRDEESVRKRGETIPGIRTVAKKEANPFGLYDMLGNVWEWCHDWRGKYSAEKVVDPRGPEAGSRRILRGGAWDSHADVVRAAFRHSHLPNFRGFDLGFRIAGYQGF